MQSPQNKWPHGVTAGATTTVWQMAHSSESSTPRTSASFFGVTLARWRRSASAIRSALMRSASTRAASTRAASTRASSTLASSRVDLLVAWPTLGLGGSASRVQIRCARPSTALLLSRAFWPSTAYRMDLAPLDPGRDSTFKEETRGLSRLQRGHLGSPVPQGWRYADPDRAREITATASIASSRAMFPPSRDAPRGARPASSCG